MKIRRFSTADVDFDSNLKALLAFETAQDDSIDEVVASILKDVKKRGDAAVLEYTNRFDRLSATSMAELELSQDELHQALAGLYVDHRRRQQGEERIQVVGVGRGAGRIQNAYAFIMKNNS